MTKKSVGSFEAKTHLLKLLEAVSQGETITITRRGEPVALLSPAKPQGKDTKAVITELRRWRQGIHCGKGMSTSQARKKGQR